VRLRQLSLEYGIEVVHKAFVLRPEEQANPTFTDYHLQHRSAARIRTGLPYGMPRVGAPYPRSSMPALEASKWVEKHEPERFEAFDQGLFRAFFEESRDIGDPEVLREIAREAEVGQAGAMIEALESVREDVARDHQEAMMAGITAIPAVRIGRHLISGAVPYETYVDTLVQP
jgi:predicted DsbA family dithiol-disulfide isomerase